MRSLIITLALSLTLTGCASSSVQTPEALPTIGDTVVDGDRAIAVKQIETMDEIRVSNQFADPIQGPIVVVQMGIKNTGTESGNVLFSEFGLRDSQGRTYDEITDLTYSLWRDDIGVKTRGEDLYPGEVRVDVAAFRVAPDADGLTLLWSGNEILLN